MKQIILDTNQVKKLIELMYRGLAYTDEHYRENAYEPQKRIFNTVMKQLKDQGMFKDYFIYE